MTLIYSTLSGNSTITIAKGNWDAFAMANFLSYSLAAESISVEYDPGLLKFLFTPNITVVGGTARKMLGFSESGSSGSVDRSPYVVNFCPLQNFVIQTNFSVFDINSTSTIGVVPIECNYGDYIQFDDYMGSHPYLMVDHHVIQLQVALLDDRGNALETYLDTDWANAPTDQFPEWSFTIAFEPIDNKGFVPVAVV